MATEYIPACIDSSAGKTSPDHTLVISVSPFHAPDLRLTHGIYMRFQNSLFCLAMNKSGTSLEGEL